MRRSLQGAILLVLSIGQPDRNSAAGAVEPLHVVRGVPYVSRDGQDLRADIYMPDRADVSPGILSPGILMVHGGAWMSGDKVHVARHARYAASRGYVVVAINYRLAPTHTFPAQLEDCRAAVRWMRDHARTYRLDPLRLAGYGYSAGGHLVCLLGTGQAPPGQAPPGEPEPERSGPGTRLQAIVAGGAPCDFRHVPDGSQGLSYWLGGTRREQPHTYRLASPAAFVTADDPPTFFFHGQRDRLVPLTSSQRMMRNLQQVGVQTDLFVVDGVGHIGAFLDHQAPRLAVDFLDRVLRDSEAHGR